VTAYKFLQAGRVGPFSGFAWPEGVWVEAVPSVCASGVHACEAADLPYWINTELWEVELDGAERHERKLVAARGRLVKRIHAWDAGAQRAFAEWCLERGQSLAAVDEHVAEHAADIALHASNGAAAPAGFIAARAAEIVRGPDAYTTERGLQAEWLSAHLGLA